MLGLCVVLLLVAGALAKPLVPHSAELCSPCNAAFPKVRRLMQKYTCDADLVPVDCLFDPGRHEGRNQPDEHHVGLARDVGKRQGNELPNEQSSRPPFFSLTCTLPRRRVSVPRWQMCRDALTAEQMFRSMRFT